MDLSGRNVRAFYKDNIALWYKIPKGRMRVHHVSGSKAGNERNSVGHKEPPAKGCGGRVAFYGAFRVETCGDGTGKEHLLGSPPVETRGLLRQIEAVDEELRLTLTIIKCVKHSRERVYTAHHDVDHVSF